MLKLWGRRYLHDDCLTCAPLGDGENEEIKKTDVEMFFKSPQLSDIFRREDSF